MKNAILKILKWKADSDFKRLFESVFFLNSFIWVRVIIV